MMDASLQTLPVELIYRIFDHLDVETIILHVRCVSKRLHSMTKGYDRYTLDLRLLSITDFHTIQKLIQPRNVIALTLKERWHIPGPCKEFFNTFNIQQFARLRSLTVDADSYWFLHWLEKSTMTLSLNFLTINIHDDSSFRTNEDKNLLSSILSKFSLRKLNINEHRVSGRENLVLDNIQWPIDYTLECLTVNCVTLNTFYIICIQLPKLRILNVGCLYAFSLLKVVKKPADIKPLLNLTSMSLHGMYSVDMEELKSVLLLVPNLTHLRIHGESDLSSPLIDGTQWKEFIQARLAQLKRFEFHFHCSLSEMPTSNIVEEIIAPFQTPFWLENKYWPVRCTLQCASVGHARELHLYSIPMPEDYIEHHSDGKHIIHSKVNNVDHHFELFTNIKRLKLFIDQVPDGITSENVFISPKPSETGYSEVI